MKTSPLSITDYAVLGLLAERPKHGFAISKELGPDSQVGRVLTVRRPLVYRALDRLIDLDLAEPIHTEPGDAGPQRTVLRVTRKGRGRLNSWLSHPVTHVREMRIEFQLKLVLLERSGKSAMGLVLAQREALEPTLTALDTAGTTDHLELWRRRNAIAATEYLADLEQLYSGRSSPED